MRWLDIKLLQKQTEKDRLGNDFETGRYTTLAETSGRFSPWADTDVMIEGRDVTENEQRYLVPVDFYNIKDATHAEIEGHIVEITSITNNFPRWTVLQVRKWKS